MQRSLTKPLPAFDNNLRAFAERKFPCELFSLHHDWYLDPDFDRWFAETTKKKEVKDCLQELYSCFGILPAPVLLILAKTQQLLSTRPQPIDRDVRQRRADIKALESALEVMKTYPAGDLFYCGNGLLIGREQMEQEWTVKKYLEDLRDAIGMIKPRKQVNVEMRFCAQTLRDFFQNVIGNNLYQQIGDLMKSAFPEEWGASDPDTRRLAALQRAKGPSINAHRFTLQEALDLQKRDPEHQRFWREKGKEISLIRSRARKEAKVVKREDNLIRAALKRQEKRIRAAAY